MNIKHPTKYKQLNIPHDIKLSHLIGFTALGSLILLGIAAITPTTNTTHADSLVSTLNTKTTANLYSMISLSLSDSIDIDLTPKSVGSLAVGKAEVRVSTNNTTGYSIYLSTVDGTNNLNAVNQDQHYIGEEDTDYSIKALPTSTKASAYLENNNNLNTWGYALTNTNGANNDTTYQGLTSTTGDTIYSTKSTSSNDTYDLNIAVAVDASLPAGAYRNGIVVSAIANPIELRGFNEIYYMQEMTPDVCTRANVGDEGQLVDKRDQTIYWVAKLKDNNCWMTQNLDLDLSTSVTLTPEDTDLLEGTSFTPTHNTNEIVEPTDETVSEQNSWNFGKVVAGTPSLFNRCEYHQSTTSSIGDSAYLGENLGVTCAKSGFIDVSSGWTNNFNVQNGTSTYNENTNTITLSPTSDGDTIIAADTTAKSYDSHYLIGNYYTPSVLTAGSLEQTSVKNVAPASICPKGWRMPNGAYETYGKPSENNDYYKLFHAYGFPNIDGYFAGESNIYGTNVLPEAGKNIYIAPYYMARNGSTTPTNGGTLRYAGSDGVYANATKIGTDAIIRLLIGGGGLGAMFPNAPAGSNHGMAVRCLAR